MARDGKLDAGCDLMLRAVRKNPRWIETLDRLVAADWLAGDVAEQVKARLTATAGRQ